MPGDGATEESNQIGRKANQTLLDFVLVSLTSVLNLQRMPSASRVDPIALNCQCPAEVKLWLRRPLSTGLLRAFHHPALRNAKISFSIRRSLIWVLILTKNDTVGSASGLSESRKAFDKRRQAHDTL